MLSLLLFLATLLISFRLWIGQTAEIFADQELEQRERFATMDRRFSESLARSTALAAKILPESHSLGAEVTPEEIGELLHGEMSGGEPDFDLLWVFDGADREVFSWNTPGLALGAAPAFSPRRIRDRLRLHRSQWDRVFLSMGDHIAEIAVETRGGDAPNRSDLVVAARVWDSAWLEKLSFLTDTRIRMVPIAIGFEEGLPRLGITDAEKERILRVYFDLEDNPLFAVDVGGDPPLLASMIRFIRQQVWLILFLAVVNLLLLLLFLTQWVAKPLAQIVGALAEEKPAALSPLAQTGGEFGRLAQLVKLFFAQRESLREEAEERRRVSEALRASEQLLRDSVRKQERLARDLHDGMIQSIYAIGLRLQQLRKQRSGAGDERSTKLLDDSVGELNAVIRDVRGFIREMEPEVLSGTDLHGALTRLSETMTLPPGCAFSLHVEPSAVRPLSREQNLQLFHIAHELFSNAIRHSQANHIRCNIGLVENELVLMVEDDGIGFDPTNPSRIGRGLRNLRSRAMDIDAKISFQSQPGGPTMVRITLPMNLYSER